MAGKPDFSGIGKSMKAGEDFSLTKTQYLISTGKSLPLDRSYTEKRSAVARFAKEHGYCVQVVPEVIRFIRIREE